MRLVELRNTIEKFTEEISKVYYLQGAGLGDEASTENVYKKYPALFSDENKKCIEHMLREAVTDEDKSRLKKFLEAFYCEMISEANKELNNMHFMKESAKIDVNGELISYRSLMVLMYNEQDRSKKQLLRKRLDEHTDAELNPLLEEIFQNEQRYINEFGFLNKIEMFNSLTGIDLGLLNEQMQQFLKDTENVYIGTLEKLVREKLNCSLGDIHRDDLNSIIRAHEFDHLFPKERMVEAVTSFIEEIGLKISGNGIIYDLEARDNKSFRAFCSPVRIPDEIYLVINPMGGEENYSAFLHELGHAMHYAGINNTLPFEYKWYGDNSVTEAYAMTFDALVSHEGWMAEYIGSEFSGNKDYYRHRAFNELVMLRGFAAKLDYELKLNESKDLAGSPSLYMEILENAMKVKYSGSMYLSVIDSYFYVARYIRAFMLRANIHEYLNVSLGNKWYKSKKTGELLSRLWSYGQKYNADEISAILGGKLSMKPHVEYINSILVN